MISKSPTFFAGWVFLAIVLMSGLNTAEAQCDGNCGNPNCGVQAVAAAPNTCANGQCRQRRCRTGRCCNKCPKCQQDFCQLEVKKGKEKRTCYKTEQKLICIPSIRLPWQKCQPTCSKTKVVNVLKKHKYECPKCEYKWSVYEPEVPQPEDKKPQAETTNPNELQYQYYQDQNISPREPFNYDSLQQGQPVQQPRYKPETFDPTGSDVPAPPKK